MSDIKYDDTDYIRQFGRDRRRIEMSKEYYVIVDLYNLTYMQNGNSAKIDEADKFETVEKAKKELKNYDEDFNGAIYKVKEYTTINLEKMED